MIAPLLALALAAAPPPAVRRALVVAYDGSDRPDTPALRYADDDGLRDAEVLTRLGVQVELLTVADADTAREASPLLAQARPPTPAELDAAVARLAAAFAADRAAGRRTEAMVFYVGHGAVDEAGRAYLTLQGGRLDRAALGERVVSRLGADLVHVVVDACRAAGVVGHRGADPAVLAQVQTLLEGEQLASAPGVGVLYAESEDGRTHEWSRLRAGVFSHLVRSGLLGAADVNRDGRVEYSELEAFVAASLLGVQDARARLRVVAAPPQAAPRAALVEAAPPGPALELPAGFASARVTVADEEGVPLADLNRAGAAPVHLALPPRPGYWLRTPRGEARLGPDPARAPLPELRPIEVSMRGPEEESLARGLFAVGFDRSFYEGYVASTRLAPVEFAADKAPAAEAAAPAEPGPSGPLGLELAAQLQRAALNAASVGGGVAVSYRHPAGEPWRVGARAGWSYAPGAWLEGKASLHRLSVLGLAGAEWGGAAAPFAEAGLGYLAVLATGAGPLSGDTLAGTARLAAGVAPRLGTLRLRAAVSLDADLVDLDHRRQAFLLPGAEVGVEF